MSDEKQYKILNKEDLGNSELEVEVEIPYQNIEKYREKAIKKSSEDLEIPGFRKGSAPEKMVVEKIGEMAILERAAYDLMGNIVPLILASEKIEAIDQPQINITKIAPKSDLVFKMKVTLLPKVELPNYKEIAKEIKPTDESEVTEKEMDDYIKFIREQRAKALKNASQENTENKEGEDKKDEELKLPEFNDDFVKSLGDFKNVDEFKKQLKENMSNEKKNKEVSRRRLEIMEKIIAETKVDVPKILIDQETERMMGQFRHDIERMGMKFEDYLKEIKKTEEDLRKEWNADATKRAKMNLILPKISAEEKLSVDDKKVGEEVKHLMSHHKDINEVHAKLYVRNVLMNEEVFKFLENIK